MQIEHVCLHDCLRHVLANLFGTQSSTSDPFKQQMANTLVLKIDQNEAISGE